MLNRKYPHDDKPRKRPYEDKSKRIEINPEEFLGGPKIAVVGVGGGGGNAIQNLLDSGELQHVKLVIANTDIQDLKKSTCPTKIQLGPDITQGLGAGGDPRQGALAAQESMYEIEDAIKDNHMIFLAFSAGGGTGTGASEEIALAAREMGSLVICVTTTPFVFEGSRRMKVAKDCIEHIQDCCDILVVIPNENVLKITNAGTSITDAFKAVDNILSGFVSSITRIITKPGLVNIDFADVRSALHDMRTRAMIGIGEAEGDGRGLAAAEQALSSPLLDNCSLCNARSVIVSVEGGHDMSLMDVNIAVERIQKEVAGDGDAQNCRFFFGASFDDALEGKLRVTVLAALMGPERKSSQDSRDHSSASSLNSTYTTASQDTLTGTVHSANEDRNSYSATQDSHWWGRFTRANDNTGTVRELSHDDLFKSSLTDGSEIIRRNHKNK